MKRKIKRTLEDFRLEFRKQIATFIIGAFSFVAALIWRDTIRSFIDSLVKTEALRSVVHSEWVLNLITALIVTVIAVLGIIITTRFISPKEE